MPDSSIPEIRVTNELLRDVLKAEQAAIAHLQQQSATMERGFSSLQQQVGQQTSTLVDVQLISYLAELEAIKTLIDREKDEILYTARSEEAALQSLEATFERRKDAVVAKRSKQVNELLEIVNQVWDVDLVAHVAERESAIGMVLDNFAEVTEKVVNDRKGVLGRYLDAAGAAVSDALNQREELKSDVRAIQHSDMVAGEEARAAFAVPFYVLEIEGTDGSVGIRVVPPSQLRTNSGHPLGAQLEPLAGFEPITEDFRSRAKGLLDLCRNRVRARETSGATLLQYGQSPSGLAAAAWAAMGRALTGRSLTVRDRPTDPKALAQRIATHQGDFAIPESVSAADEPAHVVQETPPEFTRAERLIDQGDFATALVLLDQLVLRGYQSEMLSTYRELCVEALAPSATDPSEAVLPERELQAEPAARASGALLEQVLDHIHHQQYRSALDLLDLLQAGGGAPMLNHYRQQCLDGLRENEN